MSDANFTVVSFIEHLGRPSEHRGSHENDLRGTGGTTSYPFVGTQTPEHNFFIDGDPDPKGAPRQLDPLTVCTSWRQRHCGSPG